MTQIHQSLPDLHQRTPSYLNASTKVHKTFFPSFHLSQWHDDGNLFFHCREQAASSSERASAQGSDESGEQVQCLKVSSGHSKRVRDALSKLERNDPLPLAWHRPNSSLSDGGSSWVHFLFAFLTSAMKKIFTGLGCCIYE